nr:uncharacterized protein LOC105335585 [Crassostrea gigas]
MYYIGILTFLLFVGAHGFVLQRPTTVVKALNGETVMNSGPPIGSPDQSTQNQNRFMRDPTILDARRNRAGPVIVSANAMMPNKNRIIASPGSNNMAQEASNVNISDMVAMMMNMMSNEPNMADVMADNTAKADMINALSSATEVMSKLKANMNQPRRLNMQSPTKTLPSIENLGYIVPSMMNANIPSGANMMTGTNMMPVIGSGSNFIPTESQRPSSSNINISPRRY